MIGFVEEINPSLRFRALLLHLHFWHHSAVTKTTVSFSEHPKKGGLGTGQNFQYFFLIPSNMWVKVDEAVAVESYFGQARLLRSRQPIYRV